MKITLLALTLSSCLALPLNPQPSTLSQSQRAAAPAYKLVDLGTLPGGHYSGAKSVNNRGEIVGWSDTGGATTGMLNTRAVVWRNGKIQALQAPKGDSMTCATKINDKGQILIVPEAHAARNSAIDVILQSYALLWQAGKTVSADISSPNGLDNRGRLAGQGGMRAAVWSGGKQTAVRGLPDNRVSMAYDVNDAGDIVGSASTEDRKTSHAFLFSKGALADLGIPNGLAASQAQAINNRGQVLVWAYTPVGRAQAFLWATGRYTALCSPDEQDIWAYSLNNKGQVVGSASGRAFLWSEGKRRDLNALIPKKSNWILTEARSINDKGQIVGTGRLGGKERAFLLEPAHPPR